MIATLAAGVLFVANVVPVQDNVRKQIYDKSLSVVTKTLMTPLPLRGLKVIAAEEYLIEGQNPLRLYRYSVKGDVDSFVDKAMTQLEGWTKHVMTDNKGQPRPGEGYILDSPTYGSGPVISQSISVGKGRFIKDAHAHWGARREKTPGWIMISYNEEPRPRH